MAKHPTYKIAMAAGQDAGNRSMKAAGRTSWSDEDFDAAAERTQQLLMLVPAEDGGLNGLSCEVEG